MVDAAAAVEGSTEIEFDDTRFPIVHIKFPMTVGLDALKRYCSRCDRYGAAGTRWVQVNDFSVASPISYNAAARKLVADWERGFAERYATTIIGEVRIVPRAVQRGIFTAYSWLFRAPWPVRNLGSPAQAEEEIQAWLDAE